MERISPEGTLVHCAGQSIDFIFYADPKLKRRHFWIWSDGANTGKTTFLHELSARFPSIYINPNGDRQQSFPDPTGAQLVLIDAARRETLRWDLIEAITSGSPIRVLYKSGGIPVPAGAILVIASNYAPFRFFGDDIFENGLDQGPHRGIFHTRFAIKEFQTNDIYLEENDGTVEKPLIID